MSAIPLREINARIDQLDEMRALPTTEFAEENGLADSLVRYFIDNRKNLKATQLRKVFQSIKSIQRNLEPRIRKNTSVNNEPFERAEISSVMINLAYANGRNLIPDEFYKILKQCLSAERLKTNEDFIRVAQFVEAILAYYKFRGGAS